MAQKRRGCAPAVFVIVLVVAAIIALFVWLRNRKEKPPPPSGAELQVHVLDVGQGDSILIISPTGKTVLVDAGVPGSGKAILAAMNRYNVQSIDLFIATHAHADHIGAADEVIRAVPTRAVLDSGVTNTTKNYQDFLEAVKRSNAAFIQAEPGKNFDLGGGAFINVLAPIKPFFTASQLRSGGNEPNANSVVARLDYGDFSLLLTGDAEAQTEERMMSKDENLAAKILKVGHHGSKYATSEQFLQRVKPEVAVISDGAQNRYGHPSQDALDRLRAAHVKIYRTDLQGEITITSKGKGYEIKAAREAKENELFAGREAQRDDSARRGFVDFGDYGGPPPRPPKEARK
ncbi:MAG: ComEC/Rec2 family competence protein [Pyrinomonadaceae bacterium]